MTTDRIDTSGRPSLWRALDAPAEVRHTTTAHPAVAPEHRGLYTYTVHPMPAAPTGMAPPARRLVDDTRPVARGERRRHPG